MEKIERGVMVMKEGRAWGIRYEDGRSTEYGWMNPINAPIHNPEFCKKPTDITYPESHNRAEISTGKLVHVIRKITVRIVG